MCIENCLVSANQKMRNELCREMRLHQGGGTPHSLQTPVGCWRTQNGSTTEEMKDLFFQLMKAVSQISC